MGRVVTQLADLAIITSDNPRSENPQEIIQDIKKGIVKNNYAVVPERREAIRKALSIAKPQDTVLIAGKGHEHYQILKDRTIPFFDCEVVRECLKSLKY
jgi:UDP-N-acetylmuramoyl-L-alanyl-D-glutamate--2,6-diaminopimelate ligase